MQTKPIIINPNSSGQGTHESFKAHPFYPILKKFGYTYTHSTPIGYAANDEQRWFLLHTFMQMGSWGQMHTVSIKHNENNSNHAMHWETSCGAGAGKRGSGEESLVKHLQSKAKRYLLKEPWEESDFVKFRVCGRYVNTEKNFPAREYTDWRSANSINLWNGTVWGIREDGTKMLLKRVIN